MYCDKCQKEISAQELKKQKALGRKVIPVDIAGLHALQHRVSHLEQVVKHLKLRDDERGLSGIQIGTVQNEQDP